MLVNKDFVEEDMGKETIESERSIGYQLECHRLRDGVLMYR